MATSERRLTRRRSEVGLRRNVVAVIISRQQETPSEVQAFDLKVRTVCYGVLLGPARSRDHAGSSFEKQNFSSRWGYLPE